MKRNILTIFGLLAIATSTAASDTTEKFFVKKRYSIQGSAVIETIDGQNRLTFSDDFKTKNGPDLKIYLSKTPLEFLSAQEVDKSAIRLSVLKSNKGSQSYIIPADISLEDYESVVIQCEAYTVLWGGFDL